MLLAACHAMSCLTLELFLPRRGSPLSNWRSKRDFAADGPARMLCYG